MSRKVIAEIIRNNGDIIKIYSYSVLKRILRESTPSPLTTNKPMEISNPRVDEILHEFPSVKEKVNELMEFSHQMMEEYKKFINSLEKLINEVKSMRSEIEPMKNNITDILNQLDSRIRSLENIVSEKVLGVEVKESSFKTAEEVAKEKSGKTTEDRERPRFATRRQLRYMWNLAKRMGEKEGGINKVIQKVEEATGIDMTRNDLTVDEASKVITYLERSEKEEEREGKRDLVLRMFSMANAIATEEPDKGVADVLEEAGEELGIEKNIYSDPYELTEGELQEVIGWLRERAEEMGIELEEEESG